MRGCAAFVLGVLVTLHAFFGLSLLGWGSFALACAVIWLPECRWLARKLLVRRTSVALVAGGV